MATKKTSNRKRNNPDVRLRGITMQAKCIMGHKFTMGPGQIREAQHFGCAMCPTCGNPATVSKINL